MKKLISLALAAVLIIVLAVPVMAADEDGNWLQVLSYSTVNNSGANYFVVNKSATISLELPSRTYGVWVDMLVNTSDMDISTVYSIWQGSYTKLTVSKIDDGLHRVFGRLSYHTYTQLQFQFNCSGSGYYELLSCKLSSISESVLYADSFMDFWYFNWNGSTLEQNYQKLNQNSSYTADPYGEGAAAPWQACVQVLDWQNFDEITVWGSVDLASLSSVRATIGNISLPVTLNYIDVNTGEYTEAPDLMYPDYYGKYLYSITVDISDVNPALSSQFPNLLVYMTGKYWDKTGMIMGFQYVTGDLAVADTVDANWWNRFTSFMRDLLGADDSSGALDDLGGSSDSITQDAADIHDFEQSQQAVLDSNFSTIQSAVTFTNFAAALTFVQRYSNMAFAGISDYSIVLTLPLFLGLFFYLCSRIPGVTRWKSRPPKGKGGGDP